MRWLRLWVDEILKGTTFDELSLSERGLWFSLLLLAGNSLTPGIVEMRKGVGYSQEILAGLVNCDRKTLQKGLKKLISVGKISPVISLNPGKVSPQKDQKSQKIDDFMGIFPHRNSIRLQITNWSKYQTRYEKYYKNPNSEQEEKPTENGIDMPGRLEEEKKKIYKEIACRCLDYLNEVSNRRFTQTDRNLSYIIARLGEKHTEENCRYVIEIKWQDSEFDKKYFRPSTLFNSDKFEGYLNESKQPKRFDEE